MDFWFRRGVRCFRTGIGAYPSAICEGRTTKSEPKRHAALRVAPFLGSGFVAPRSQPHFGGCSLVASRQNPKAAQPVYSYLRDTTLAVADSPVCELCPGVAVRQSGPSGEHLLVKERTVG